VGILQIGTDELGGTEEEFSWLIGETDVEVELKMLATSTCSSGVNDINAGSGIYSLARDAWSTGI
jgi:hypothetical protein